MTVAYSFLPARLSPHGRSSVSIGPHLALNHGHAGLESFSSLPARVVAFVDLYEIYAAPLCVSELNLFSSRHSTASPAYSGKHYAKKDPWC